MRWFSTFDALLFPETKTEKKLNKQQKICAIYRRAAIAQSTVRKRFANFWQHCSRSCRRNGIWVFYDLTAGNLMDRIYISNVKKTGPFFKKIDHRRWNMDCLQSCGAKMSKGKRNELTIAKSGLSNEEVEPVYLIGFIVYYVLWGSSAQIRRRIATRTVPSWAA